MKKEQATMRTITVNIELPESIRPEMEWAWDLFCRHFQLPYRIEGSNIGDLLIGTEENEKADLRIAHTTQTILEQRIYQQWKVFPEEPVIRTQSGERDLLGTSFYMVNSLQEWGQEQDAFDELGRFKWEHSFQYRFDVLEHDLVSELFEALYEELQPKLGERIVPKPSELFLTHDIDRIQQGDLREGYYKLKKGRVVDALHSGVNWLLGEHEWQNIEDILEMHSKRGLSSTYFWITEKGRDEQGILNADHDVSRPLYQNLMKQVQEKGSTNGLHKSTFRRGFREEFAKLGNAEPINRNHYLKIRLPDHYQNCEDAGLLLDASLGFSEAIGFRNSYGRPFHPYDPRTRQRMELLEVPLQIMDTTLFRSYSDPLHTATSFLERNGKGKVLSLLWHNNHLTEGRFKYRKQVYSELLDEAERKGMSSITPQELLQKSSAPDFSSE